MGSWGLVELGNGSLGLWGLLRLWELGGLFWVWGLERCPKNEVVMQVVEYAIVSFITFDIVPKLLTYNKISKFI